MEKIIEEIKKHKKIILLRHVFPDFDAIGSQMSLFQFINDNFENKTVLCGGLLPEKYACVGLKNELKKEDFENSLVLITDTATLERIDIPDLKWLKIASVVVKIDHHVNVQSYADYEIVKPEYPATCELLTDLFSASNYVFSKQTAYYLYHGLVTDTDRFMYRNVTQNTFKAAGKILEKGIEIEKVYKNLYNLKKNEAKLKGFIYKNFVSLNSLNYIFISKKVLKKFKILEPNDISLWVNMLGEIENPKIWIMFVEIEKYIRVEFRSQNVDVRKIAENFGGGGHLTASGAKLNAASEIKKVVNFVKNKT